MPRVELWGSLREAAGRPPAIVVEASTVREMLDALSALHPAIASAIERGVSVSIDGKIYRNAWLAPIGPDSEVHLLPRLNGG